MHFHRVIATPAMIDVQSRTAPVPLVTTLDGTAIIAILQSNAGEMQDEHAPAAKHVRHAPDQAGPRATATDGGEPVKRRRSRQVRKALHPQESRRAPTVGTHQQRPASELGSPTASRRHAAQASVAHCTCGRVLGSYGVVRYGRETVFRGHTRKCRFRDAETKKREPMLWGGEGTDLTSTRGATVRAPRERRQRHGV